MMEECEEFGVKKDLKINYDTFRKVIVPNFDN